VIWNLTISFPLILKLISLEHLLHYLFSFFLSLTLRQQHRIIVDFLPSTLHDFCLSTFHQRDLNTSIFPPTKSAQASQYHCQYLSCCNSCVFDSEKSLSNRGRHRRAGQQLCTYARRCYDFSNMLREIDEQLVRPISPI
jgi:hypothetical protein